MTKDTDTALEETNKEVGSPTSLFLSKSSAMSQALIAEEFDRIHESFHVTSTKALSTLIFKRIKNNHAIIVPLQEIEDFIITVLDVKKRETIEQNKARALSVKGISY